MTDITTRVDSQRRLQEMVSVLSAIHDIGERSTGHIRIEQTLQRTAEAAATLLRTDVSCILLLPLVPALAGPLNQALLIIIVNVAQAIAEGREDGQEVTDRIVVSTSADEESGEIRMADTGGGIPESVQSRVFDPFFTTKEICTGSGQGLSIAHKVVVEQHRGSLTFDVDPGVGTTFVIRPPLTVAP